MLAKRCLELGTLFLHKVLQIVRFLHGLFDRPCLGIQLLGLLLLSCLLLLLQFGAHLTHPLFLHDLHTQIVALGLLGLLFQEHAAPQEDAKSHKAQEDNHNPAVTQQWRGDGDIECCLVFTHCSVLVHHAHMEHIVTMFQRHISNVRIVLLGLNPLIAETLKHIYKSRCIMHLALVGGQLYGKLVLIVAKYQFLACVQVFVHNHTSIVLFADAKLLSEELQSTEDRRLGIVDIGNQLGVNHIHAIHTAHQYQSILGYAYRTLVVRALL